MMEREHKQVIGFVVGLLCVGMLAYYLGHAGEANAQSGVRDAAKQVRQSAESVKDASESLGQSKEGQSSARPLTVKDISLEQAQQIVQAALDKARQLKIKSNVAVVDRGGNLKAFARMDGAWLGSIDIAIKKAKTSRYFDMPTGQVGKLSQPGKSLYMIEVSNDGLVSFPGGVPLKSRDGQVIGAVGSSGSSVTNDRMVAKAGAKVIGSSQQ